MNKVREFSQKVIQNVHQVIVGYDKVIELLMVALFCEGHVLIEDVPGTGKTMLGRSLAISLGGSFKRIQCTPDLLPNDITGVSVYNQQNTQFEFKPGPVFVNVLLTDEINRATPRTQSALLEAMQEQQVSIDGVTYPLPRPFLVIATQNPVEYEGTFNLPEAQLDRFLMRISLGYPSAHEEKTILAALQREHPIHSLKQVVEIEDLIALHRNIWDVYVDVTLRDYIVSLMAASRNHPDLALGGSPRAGLALFKSAQGLAALRGRDHVIPDDIKYLAHYVLPHRLMLKPEARLRGRSVQYVIENILEHVPLTLGPFTNDG